MTTQGVFSLRGMEEYLENLASAGENVDDAAKRAVMAGTEVAQTGMKRRAAYLTGNLQEHIQIKGPEQDGNFISAEVGLIHEKAYTDAETARYGNANEYGTSSMPAHPFIRPTLKTDASKIRRAERESLKKDSVI
jgi:HK97 gp10 family phage protein